MLQGHRKEILDFIEATNNEPILIRNNEIIELQKDKMPVGKVREKNRFCFIL
ncbi:MAG: hypothetical protein H7141_03350 [Burkholderiales bacterium]|nr:hypothetical protein [Bacteroidia bacterium]